MNGMESERVGKRFKNGKVPLDRIIFKYKIAPVNKRGPPSV